MAKAYESSEIITSATPDKTEELELNQLTELKSLSQNHKLYKQTVGGKVYFIKAINKAQGNYAREKALLEREHTILSGASSKHIVKSYGMFHDDSLGYYLKLDYIEGDSLSTFLRSNPDAKTRTLILNDILEAVEDLHARGIVHNDIKPQNFMVRKEGNRAVLVDFGLSDSDSYTEKSQGYTRQYASPEQTSGGETHIPTDIYALGKIIKLIFPHRYAFICRKCRRTNPKHRYRNISEIKSAIATADRARALLLLLPLMIIAIAALWWFKAYNHPTATPPKEVSPVIVKDTVFKTDTISSIDTIKPIIHKDSGHSTPKSVSKTESVTKQTVTKEETITKEETVTKDTVTEDPVVKIYEQLYQQAVQCADERKIKERAAYKCWDIKVFNDAQMYIIDNFPHEIGLSKKLDDLYVEYANKYGRYIKDFPYAWETSENIKSQPPKPDPNIWFAMSQEDSVSFKRSNHKDSIMIMFNMMHDVYVEFCRDKNLYTKNSKRSLENYIIKYHDKLDDIRKLSPDAIAVGLGYKATGFYGKLMLNFFNKFEFYEESIF